MFRNLKMRTVTTIVVAISVALGLCLLCVIASRNSNKMLENKINDNMSTYLNAQEKAIEKFVKDSEEKLVLYSKNPLIKKLIMDDHADQEKTGFYLERNIPAFTDEEYNTSAYFNDNYPNYPAVQDYTLDYYGRLENWEGLYIGNTETRLLAYSVPPVIGKVLRTDDGKRQELMNELKKAGIGGVYNAGIIVSPGTGQLCLSMYSPVCFDEDGNPIGYVGAGVFNTELEKILAENDIAGVDDKQFYMFNNKTGVLFMDTSLTTDEKRTEKIAKETDDVMLKAVRKRISDGETSGHFEFTDENFHEGKPVVVNYESVSGHDWTVVLCADKDALYQDSNSNIRNMIIVCVISFLVILIFVIVAISLLTSPLTKITDAIKDLGQLNLKENEDVKSRADNGNEIGEIAHEIENLRTALSNITGTLKKCSSSLDSSAGNMLENSNALVGYVSDSTATTQDLASSLTSTNNIVDSVSGNIRRMNGLVENVSGSMKESSEQSGNILAAAESMEQRSAQTLAESKKNITDNRAAIQDVMTKLQALSKINTFVDDILSIASQTKLLSLNASIEAARAGEHGKGFSVVATEIGILATNTSTAAQNIQDITRLTNESIEETVKYFNELNEYLEKDIMSKFEEFNTEAQNNNNITSALINNINEVSKNINEFQKFVNDLVAQMAEIKNLSRQNSSGIDNIVSKNEDTSKIAENIAGAASTNKDNAKMLGEIVSKFTS